MSISITLVGGFYHEVVEDPDRQSLLGSGGRAAVFLRHAARDAKIKFVTSILQGEQFMLKSFCVQNSLELDFCVSGFKPMFLYDYSIVPPTVVHSAHGGGRGEISAHSSDLCIGFELLEADCVLSGRNVVYDPQGLTTRINWEKKIQYAENLVFICNSCELFAQSGFQELDDAATDLIHRTPISTLVVKNGTNGVTTFSLNAGTIEKASFPSYYSERVHKVGTGDIFTAAFAYHNIVRGYSVWKSTELASRCVSVYAESGEANFHWSEEKLRTRVAAIEPRKQIYLAAPFFSREERLLVSKVYGALHSLNTRVFSPINEVGLGGEPQAIVEQDIKGLDESDLVFAVLTSYDPGTCFEIGYAIKKGIPVICYYTGRWRDGLTMFEGSTSHGRNCRIFDHLATAIYHARWSITKNET